MTRLDRGLASAANTALGTKPTTKEMRTILRALPVMLHTSGLVTACAYLLSRAQGRRDDRHWVVASALLADALVFIGEQGGDDPLVMLDRTIALPDDQRYLIAEARARMLAGWMARLGDARYITPDPEPSGAP